MLSKYTNWLHASSQRAPPTQTNNALSPQTPVTALWLHIAPAPKWTLNMRNHRSTVCRNTNYRTALGALLYRTCLELSRQWRPRGWHWVVRGKWLLRKIGHGPRGEIWGKRICDLGGSLPALFCATSDISYPANSISSSTVSPFFPLRLCVPATNDIFIYI